MHIKKAILLFCLLFFWGLTPSFLSSLPETKIFQVAPYSALMQGGFEGVYPLKKLERQGNFGVGAFENVEGEMVAYEGRYFRIREGGDLEPAKASDKIAFAQVTRYTPDTRNHLSNIGSFKELSKKITPALKHKNQPYAICVRGKFSVIKLRTLLKPDRPNTNLNYAVKNQDDYEFKDIEGYAVGFWFPEYFGTISISGLHLHFVDKHFGVGGHVLDLSFEEGKFGYMPIDKYEIFLPEERSFNTLNLKSN